MQYLVTIFHPNDYDPSKEGAAMEQAIDALNEEMVAKGVRVFVGGLKPAGKAKTMRVQSGRHVVVTDGPYLETKEHIGGLWILEAASLEEAVEWGRKATVACRVPVEVRSFYSMEEAEQLSKRK